MRGHAALHEERWEQVFRWGPLTLFGVGTAVSAAVAPALMSRGDVYGAAGVAPVALAFELWWARPGRVAVSESAAEQAHYWIRTALAFALTWFNPLYAIYAYTGYLAVSRMLPRRMTRVGLFVNAVTIAGSQASGLPPRSTTVWILFGALIVLNSGMAAIFSALGEREVAKAKQRTDTIRQLETANTRLELAMQENAQLHAQLLVQAREAGVADERRRLAAEIHDTIAQGLAGIIAQLQAVSAASDEDVAHAHLSRAAALARHSLGEARRSVQNLSPLDLEDGALPEALKKTVDTWSDRTGVAARFTVTGTEEQLHDEVAATLLRVAQEALANADRHAAAERVGVTLSYMGDEVTLDVRDDGAGFDLLDVPERTGTGGFGLAGMRARVERIAGSLTVESEKGGGTAVSARVPLVHHG
ncbi:sensor histidine kinase [Streptomyces montanisoli]|uniref:Sensor histidine kinase n=1 Tax=Streptomyces montanisoli TaxID=2798581 RepID=A0A940M8Z8_9ACTN|nr:sensor histidine kinase [Streptomyces montanisoli]MBP0456979.1 sensor histidine kinase [Streptomyces montanisoli]